ncbi:hypothetical protein [Leeuwenhoekiella sp. LLG6367-2.1]|uniref:hypothetical protein n=1 Tax=Leeuwenhoekiella sp. LLG6367-2.1 TaxID=3160833 RepID=UPI00386DB3A5
MRKYLYVCIAFLSMILASSCREDFEATLSNGRLEFSRDTLFLDTVFSNTSSSTYSIKVYNRSNNLITIPQVGLAQGENSNYRLNVNGKAGKIFENIEILPKDSIFVFVEVTVDASIIDANDFLYTDEIEFDSGINLQKINLVTLIRDAIFRYPSRNAAGIKETLNLGTDENGQSVEIEGFFLEDDELQFTNQKPYVIYGYAGVASGKTLQIDAGARIYFHQNSGILIADAAHLQANGTISTDQDALENEIIFEGDRLEPHYKDIPGQWGTIWFTSGSTGNLNYVTIKNNEIGILAEGLSQTQSAAVSIQNSQIYNSAFVGMYGINGSISGKNVVIGNSGLSNLWLRQGGSYNFIHSTFANYWTQSFRNTPAVQIDNYLEVGDGLQVADLKEANFINCIIYGNKNLELGFQKVATAEFNFRFENCLIRFEDPFNDFTETPEYQFDNEEFYTAILLNENPLFKDTANNHYFINEQSPAENMGSINGFQQAPVDLLGNSRAESIDLGAYQTSSFELN